MHNVAPRLLAWYDERRRDLPWRAKPGERSDPYRVWLSEIMLQQTTVAAVIPYFLRFVARFPTVHDLAAAPLDEALRLWAGLGYYARARNLHACARVVVERLCGEFPRTAAALRALPGVGEYTAAAVAAIAFDEAVVPVDGNVERVVARLLAIGDALPRGKPLLRAAAQRLAPDRRAGDFAQALMDLGATLCTPRNPACARCPLGGACLARKLGDPEGFPVKEAKQAGRLRRGAAFVVRRADGCVLVRTRPPHGLLGGMTEIPTSEWAHDFDEEQAFGYAPALSNADRTAGSARPELRLLSVPSPTLHRMRGRVAGRARREAAQTQRRSRNRDPLQCDPFRAGGEGNVVWRRVPGVVRHAFTHFPLELIVFVADLPADAEAPADMRFVAPADLAREALPAVMRKALAHARLPRTPDAGSD